MLAVTLFDPAPLFGDQLEERPAAWDLAEPTEQIDAPPHSVDPAASLPEIEVRISTRRRKTSEAKWVGGKIVVSLPFASRASRRGARRPTGWSSGS